MAENETLTYGFSSVRDLYAKLQRDAQTLLDEGVTSDGLFNFVLTGDSMIDWVKNDSSLPETARTQSAMNGLYADRWLKVCKDLANASKHFTLTRGEPITLSATSEKGFGLGRFGMGGFGVGEESIYIEVRLNNQLNETESFHCLDLVNGVMNTWRDFFSTHGI